MKVLAGILVTAVAAAAATYIVVNPMGERKAAAARAELEAQMESERTRMAAELQAARDATARNQNGFVVQPDDTLPTISAAEIIEKLSKVRVPAGPARIRTQREIVFNLGRIAQLGDAAIPDIRNYLVRFEDVEYGTEPEAPNPLLDAITPQGRGGRGGPGGGGPPWGDMARDFLGRQRDPAPLDFPFPPTLRVGLVDALQLIGSPNALAALVEMLQSTGRGLEIAYIARILEEFSPGQFRNEAVGAAHDLLLNPIVAEGATGVDATQQAYLYKVLEMFKDLSFADSARSMLVGTDGRINRLAYDYLTRSLGKEALPTLYEVFNSPGLTNFMDRATLMNTALGYVGQDPYANSMFASTVTNQNIPGRMREMTVMSLARGGGGGWRGMMGGGGDAQAEVDPAVLQQQLDFLNQMRQTTQEEDILRSMDRATRDLNRQLNPDAEVEDDRGGWGGRGGRGGR